MKSILSVLILAMFVQFSFAQEEKKIENINDKEDINTIFTKENLKITGGYLAPEIKGYNILEGTYFSFGGKFAFTFNHKFSLGLAGYGLIDINNNTINIERPIGSMTWELASIDFVYGGLLMEYTFFSNKKIHFTVPLVVGAAGVYLYEDGPNTYFNNDLYEIENSAAFVIEPGVNIEFNLFRKFRLDLGASYRYVSGTELDYLDDKDLSDLSFNATFKFGFF